MTSLSPDTVRRIEDAAAALIAAGTPNPTNEQVRQHLGGGSLSHISPVMRAFRARQREQAAEQTAPLPPELAQLLTGQLGLLWQAAVKQAEAGALAAREQADDDIARADQERDEALAKVAAQESEQMPPHINTIRYMIEILDQYHTGRCQPAHDIKAAVQIRTIVT